MVEHSEPAVVAVQVCAALDSNAVAAGFAAGQRWVGEGAVSVIFCANPATLAPALRARIDDETHGPGGPLCIDLTIEAADTSDGWVVTRADLEGEPVPSSVHNLDAALVEIAAWLEQNGGRAS